MEKKVGENYHVFRNYNQDMLDKEYNNSGKVLNVELIMDRWLELGRIACDSMETELDVKYGSHPRQSLDIFPTHTPDCPILVFIHGGYWSKRAKDIGHFLAPFYVNLGINFISLDYRLVPEVSIREIIDDVRSGIVWLNSNSEKFRVDRPQIFIAGHSAGGHLAALMCGPFGLPEGIIKGGCSISGLHDLEPIRLSYLNEILKLNAADAKAFSPLALAKALSPGNITLPPFIVAVGSEEGPEYLRQSSALAAALKTGEQRVLNIKLNMRNHFSACEAFSEPKSPLSKAMLNLILN
jgi:arylformamidase